MLLKAVWRSQQEAGEARSSSAMVYDTLWPRSFEVTSWSEG
jgi:hypothetical protein